MSAILVDPLRWRRTRRLLVCLALLIAAKGVDAVGALLAAPDLPLPSASAQRDSDAAPRVALTFDDGPDPVTTPAILALLARCHVPATFFVIGRQALQWPTLLRQEQDEGHEVASHTFSHPDLHQCSPWRTAVELDLSQCVIGSATGHYALALRIPYETHPTAVDGYVAIGASVDPRDWRNDADPRRIVGDVERAVDDRSVILLHDGGGNRSPTLDALPVLIAHLRRRGFRFVTVAQMLGADLNPPLSVADRDRVGRVHAALDSARWIARGLQGLLWCGLLLSIARGATTLALGVSSRFRGAPADRDAALEQVAAAGQRLDAASAVAVSVVIAARDEASTIAAAVDSALAAGAAEVIVIDDGSVDGTATALDSYPEVRILRQPPAGKSAALNRGIDAARHAIVVCMDADTGMAPDALRQLVSGFDDPAVGAVSGRIEVRRSDTALTRWQAIEYGTSQAFERRAWAGVNAMHVVPGALGAWRREAVVRTGGFAADTLTEDTDLTWRLRAAGWRLVDAPRAVAFTDAPTTLPALYHQRLRWTFGTLQCLHKHRRLLGRHGWLGRAALPFAWSQFTSQALAPIVDAVLMRLLASDPPTAWLMALGAQAMIGMGTALLALRQDHRPLRDLGTLLLQRIVWHGLMAAISLQAIGLALRGQSPRWDRDAHQTDSCRSHSPYMPSTCSRPPPKRTCPSMCP